MSQIAEVSPILVSCIIYILMFFFFFRIKAERRASEAKLEYEQVSKLVKTEVARFEQERIEDFKDSLHAFLEGMISRQKEVRGGWGSAYFFFLSCLLLWVS